MRQALPAAEVGNRVRRGPFDGSGHFQNNLTILKVVSTAIPPIHTSTEHSRPAIPAFVKDEERSVSLFSGVIYECTSIIGE